MVWQLFAEISTCLLYQLNYMFDHSARVKRFIGKALTVKKGYSRQLRPALS